MRKSINTILISMLLCSPVTFAFDSVTRVEPLNWWVGMSNPKLQIMVTAPGAKQSWALKSYDGVILESVEFGDSPNYAFINLNISEKAKPGELELSSNDDKYRFYYTLSARAKGSADREGFSTKDVIYLITPDRFANGDEHNDSLPTMKEKADPTFRGGRHGGDLAGVITHLDYLQKLGISQLWLTPALHNDMETYSYHGYSITDLYQVDPRMGDNSLYKTLSVEAKARGIGLIMDMVPNHIGSEHPWMNDLPTQDWINYKGQFVGTSHARQTVQDTHASEFDKKRFTDGWFVPTMPDMNQRVSFLGNYLTQNAIWWIEFADLSGFRVDTFPYSDKTFLQFWLKSILAEYPNFNIVGEEWTSEAGISAYWQKGHQNKDGYESYLPTMMDFSLQQALVKALNEEENWNTGWIHVYQSIAKDFQFADPSHLLIFGDNHDMSRIYTQLHQNVKNTKLAMTLLLTMRGIPQLYYGTEVLLDNGESDDHGDIRIDFPGGFKNQQVNAFTGVGLSREQREMQLYTEKLLEIRNNYPALQNGGLIHFSPFDEMYAYARGDEHPILVILNKGNVQKTVDMNRFAEIIRGKVSATELLSGQKYELENVTIGAKSALLLAL